MLRGYRFLLTALGLALSCANHAYAKGSGEQPSAHQPKEASHEHTASRYDEAAKGAERADQQEAPCGPKQYGSNADLCAQWKAADAASDSAWWAWVAAVSTIISTAAVLVAIGLTYQANAIARDTAKRELRAYVFPSGLTLDWQISLKDGAQSAKIAVKMANSGGSPTRNLQIVVMHSVDLNVLKQFESVNGNGPSSILGPRESVMSPEILIPISDTIRYFKEDIPIYIYGGFFYEDVFRVKRETRFCYAVRFTRVGESDYPNYINWSYSGLHNCADEECVSARAAASTAKR